jgi:hypothetical protein
MTLNECTFLLLSCINFIKPLKTNVGELDRATIKRYNLAISRAAQKYDISPILLLGILKVESDFGRNQVSLTNDHGPMQINEWWFNRLSISRKTVKSPEGAMFVAAKILSYAREDNKYKPCWWSTYHSVTPVHRAKYEKNVLSALNRMGFDVDCKSPFLDDLSSANELTAGLQQKTRYKLALLKEANKVKTL